MCFMYVYDFGNLNVKIVQNYFTVYNSIMLQYLHSK